MKNKLTYFITRSSMFGIGYYLLFKYAGKDAWLSVLLGIILGIGVLYIYKMIKETFNNKEIKDVLCQSKMGLFYLIILIIFYIYLACVILVLLPMFVNSFYLLYTPKFFVVIPFLLLAINLLFILSIIIIIIYALFLTKYIKLDNILPIFDHSSFSIIKGSLVFASITSIPQIVSINYKGNSFKDDFKDYLIAGSFSFINVLFTILTLGEPLINIYSFPEYAVLKQIKILDFIENIENLSTFIWYFDLFVTLTVLINNLKTHLPNKYNKVYFNLIMVLIVFLTVFVIGSDYEIIIEFFYTYPIVLAFFFLIFISLLIYIKKSKKIKKELESN